MRAGQRVKDAAATPAPGKRPGLGLPLAILALVLLIALATGQYSAGLLDIARVIAARLTGTTSGLPATAETVVRQVRLPRVLSGLRVGAALAAAGAVYQDLFRNPLVSPDILGGLLAVALVYLVGSAVRGRDPVLVLAGVAIGAMLGAAISLLKVLADPYNQLPAITFRLLGSLASVRRGDFLSILPAMTIGLLPMLLLRWRMSLMTLDDEEARALGVETGRLRLILIAAATLMTAAAVSISGIIGWIGLLLPHVARMLVGPDFFRLLPASLILGGGYLVAIDTAARGIAAIEIPLGILTAAIGAPFFLYLLVTARRVWQ